MSEGAWRLGLLGHPVSHSLSPALHRAALEATGSLGDYTLIDCPPQSLPEAVARLGRGELDGLNATIPHKEALLDLVDELGPAARTVGAINTLCRTPEGRVEGHNTDVEGLERALSERWPEAPWRWRPVTVVGAGGAARAAVLAAVRGEACEVRVVNRTPERALRLAAQLQGCADVPILALGPERAFDDAALILQATAAGMSWRPTEPRWSALVASATEHLRRAHEGACLMDLVYRPSPTPWMLAARGLGLAGADGLSMLVHQAALSFYLWTGLAPPIEAMRSAALGALTERA